MTVKVIEVLERIKSLEIFDDLDLYFVGGTALAYYLDHRISEDIDIVSTKPLQSKKIIADIKMLGGRKLKDENAVALRIAGLFPDEYMLKFDLHGVKLEFFKASLPLQKNIIAHAETSQYLDANLSMLDVKSIAKLKLIALLSRNKSRDLFDFKVILEEGVLSSQEILEIVYSHKREIKSLKSLYEFIEKLKQSKDDEAVYLDEDEPINLTFEEIKIETLRLLENI